MKYHVHFCAQTAGDLSFPLPIIFLEFNILNFNAMYANNGRQQHLPFRSFLMSPPMTCIKDDYICIMVHRGGLVHQVQS